MIKGLNDFAKEIHDNSIKHGWWDTKREFPEVIALCHSELSEALEESRMGKEPTEVYYSKDATDKPLGVPIELADAIIRILDYCSKEGIDIEDAIRIKHEYNKSRPYRHGKRF